MTNTNTTPAAVLDLDDDAAIMKACGGPLTTFELALVKASLAADRARAAAKGGR